jgi:hypothetical protein
MALIRPEPLRQGALAAEAAKGGAAGPIQLALRVQRWAVRVRVRFSGGRCGFSGCGFSGRRCGIQPVFAGAQDLAVPQAGKS